MLLLLALLTGCLSGQVSGLSQSEPTAAPPALTAGMARLWIYRDANFYDSMATPYVHLNGAIIGVSRPGGLLYRDVTPGNYAVTVDSCGTDVNQFVTVAAASGQQLFVKILPMTDRSGSDNPIAGATCDTFYTWLMQPPVAAAEIGRLPAYNHS